MKLLQDILYQVRVQEIAGITNLAIDSLAFDSRKVGHFTLFVAVRGTQVDGHAFIDQAVSAGAIAVVCEELPSMRKQGVTYVKVENAHAALGILASNFYDNPSSELKLIGITGTNGKTTCATLLYRLVRLLGKKAGLISTVENRINHQVLNATHTTPDAIALNAMLRQMVDAECTYCMMEVSSHALHQHRVSGIRFAGGVFTNITHDHLDYHVTFDAYIGAKKLLFDMLPKESFAIVNSDDRHGATMLQHCKAGIQRSYAVKSMADFRARIVENQFAGLQLSIDGMDLYTKLVGRFNAYNILAVYATAIEMGLPKLDVLTALSTVSPPAGRFEYIKSPGNVTAIVDYAHTPDALKNVLKTIEDIRTRNEQVYTVIGCGGDRDRTKRPEMARIACKLSDRVIFTSDNPRSEDPEAIIAEMKAGVEAVDYKKTLVVVNRKEAIRLACSLAKTGDIILVAGKGHEKYQEVAGVKHPFDDMQELNESFKILHA